MFIVKFIFYVVCATIFFYSALSSITNNKYNSAVKIIVIVSNVSLLILAIGLLTLLINKGY
jgi:hypothetical protein